ncbi:complement C1q tumor necrosis factor-related protein 4-like [Mercenaria mercenaria]|uniref:complement C1q tumor necrosis factor-related protein 4-like n=1 Tax=Mercenaria mercenaria TaxID=6596 RepID=UPI00234F3F4A|nr:complement C1q tumor necrosis factor-related protein 4-like [Mercenaria mercenaria]
MSRFMCEYEIRETLTNLMDRISKLEAQQRPAVSAYVRLSETTTLGTSGRVKYNIEITNIGGAYNFEASQFIVPVPGIYIVDVTACVANSEAMNINIIKDGLKIGVVRSGSPDYVDCSSASLSIHLDAGDNIWAERGEPSYSHSLFEGRGWNSFAATLIHAD